MTTPAIDHARVAEAAYLLWLEEGRPEGRAEEHWFRALNALAPAGRTRRAAAPKARTEAKAPARPRAKAAPVA